MLKLWKIFFQYGDHESEWDVFVHTDSPRPTISDGRRYLLNVYGGEDEYMSEPELLTVDGVYELDMAHNINGDPYVIKVQE